MSGVMFEKQATNSQKMVLLDIRNHIVPQEGEHYITHTFTVPSNISKVGAILNFTKKEDAVQLYISLHDPNGFRGHQQCPGPPGERELGVWVCPDDAAIGCLAGALPEGTWRAQIDFDRLFEETDYHLMAYAEFGAVPAPVHVEYPEKHVTRQKAGWYQGELHAHSSESDASYPVETVVQAAIDCDLDFLSLTDHFTVSQWQKLALLAVNSPIAFIRSCEITAHFGHANVQGITEWVDVYVDRTDWSMNSAAHAVHQQGGLFCINHPFSGYMAWRYFDFDWHQADLMEIYHNLEGCNNAPQLDLWDRLLCSGYRIVGVGGTDSHDPFQGNHQLGVATTWVYAEELSEKGIIAGLRRGNVYVSKGAQLRFTASCPTGDMATMWESLPYQNDSPVTLHVDVLSDEPLRLFIIKNGFLLSHHIVLPGETHEWQSVYFTDIPHEPGYYRIEFHRDTQRAGHKDYPAIYWRDYSTVRALSNPIWVGKL